LKKGKIAFFATGNVHKFHEARAILRELGISTAMLRIKTNEIQANEISAIAETSAQETANKSGIPLFVEDAGLFIRALNGFPGPYSSYVYRTLDTQGILKLMKKTSKRDAYFESIVAFCDPNRPGSARRFIGKIDGRIAFKERGKQGFGFDPIFEPLANPETTFAEMTRQEKNRHSHRAQALTQFAQWYNKTYAKLRFFKREKKKGKGK
jgi:XTP/dITP diphosphohydrolase